MRLTLPPASSARDVQTVIRVVKNPLKRVKIPSIIQKMVRCILNTKPKKKQTEFEIKDFFVSQVIGNILECMDEKRPVKHRFRLLTS